MIDICHSSRALALLWVTHIGAPIKMLVHC